LNFSFYSCQQLEVQLQSNHDQLLSNDVEIQCSVDKHDQIIQTTDNENVSKNDTEELKSRNGVLRDEIQDLNFQLSTFIIQRTTTENVRKDE
jgi:hypothetical protein